LKLVEFPTGLGFPFSHKVLKTASKEKKHILYNIGLAEFPFVFLGIFTGFAVIFVQQNFAILGSVWEFSQLTQKKWIFQFHLS
jgi:hypothetical protein